MGLGCENHSDWIFLDLVPAGWTIGSLSKGDMSLDGLLGAGIAVHVPALKSMWLAKLVTAHDISIL